MAGQLRKADCALFGFKMQVYCFLELKKHDVLYIRNKKHQQKTAVPKLIQPFFKR